VARAVKKLPRFLRDEHGAAMVEFALVATVFFVPIIFGIIELGRTIVARSAVTAAAREGVRFAIVRGGESGTPADSAAIANYVMNRTKISPIVVRPSWENAASKRNPEWVQVVVSYDYTPVVPLLGARTLTSTSRQIIAY
jgi:Flp pilus assembly protein TadG